MTRIKWERAKYRGSSQNREGDQARKLLEQKATEFLGKGERHTRLSGCGKHEYMTIEVPTFSHSHAIYNDGRGERLFTVSRVVRKFKSETLVGPELVVLKDERTGLLLDPISLTVVRGVKMLKPKA